MTNPEKAKIILEKRESLSIDIESIAIATGIEKSLYRSYESGRKFVPSYDLKKIVKHLEIDPSIFNLEIERPRKPVHALSQLFQYDSNIPKASIPKNKTFFKILFESMHPAQRKRSIQTLEDELFHPNTIKTEKPHLFFWVLISFIFIALISFLTDDLVLANFALSMSIPFTLMILLLEFDQSREIKGYKLIFYFFVGGSLSIALTYMFRIFVGYPEIIFIEDLLTALVEESAKFIIVLFILSRLRIKYVFHGILIGFAVGAGFDAFETSSYGLSALFDSEIYLEMHLNIITRSLFAILGIGHHFWTALLGGTIVAINPYDKSNFNLVRKPVFLLVFLMVVLLHALWNFSSNEAFWYVSPVVIVLSLLVFIRFSKVQHSNDFIFEIIQKEKAIEIDVE